MTENKRPKIALKTSEEKPEKKEKKIKAKEEKREKISMQESLPLEEKASSQIYDPNKTKKNLRTLYIITLIVGSSIIFIDFGKATIVYATIVMFIYLIIGLRYAKTPSSKAVLADSMYYLGFLYTFVALVKVLLDIGPSSKKFHRANGSC